MMTSLCRPPPVLITRPGSIRSSPRYGLSTPYRLTFRDSARLFHHLLFNSLFNLTHEYDTSLLFGFDKNKTLYIYLSKTVKVDPPVSLVPAGEGFFELRRLAASVHCLDDDPGLYNLTC